MTPLYDLRRITSREGLIALLGIDDATLDLVLNFMAPTEPQASDKTNSVIYKQVEIPVFMRHKVPKRNRNRGFRVVWKPIFLKNCYKGLARKLDLFFRYHFDSYPHGSAFGFRSGYNIRENAQVHVGSLRLISLDIENFFPSISKLRVEQLLLGLGINGTVSNLLSRFVTIESKLPAGLPTSPVLSNAISLTLDCEMYELACKYNSRYSRYADDITFSSNEKLPSLKDIEDCLRRNDFEVASGKTRWSKRGQSHYVTGLSVSDPTQPHVPRDRKRTLRQQLYYMGKFGIDDHFRFVGTNDPSALQQSVNSIDGMIKFVAHHEPRIAGALKALWQEILRENNKRVSFTPKHQNRDPFHIYVDEAEYSRNGVPVLALAMSVSQHTDQIFRDAREVFESEMQDIWAAGKIKFIQKNGLHFADATPDLCLSYVKRLAAMPFEGFVAFHPLASQNYEQTYLRLLGSLLTRRMMAAESRFVSFLFEQNNKVSHVAIKSLIEHKFKELRSTNNRHPLAFSVSIVTKPDFGMSVPDFLLGVLGRYLQGKPSSTAGTETRDWLLFDRLRDKYRLILDLSTWTEYSRRRPIEPWR